MMKFGAAIAAAAMVAMPAMAAPRDTLAVAAFQTRDKAAAIAQVAAAEREAAGLVAAGDRAALFDRAMAIGYRAKLTRSRSDAQTSRKMFEAFAAANPRDPEAQIALGGWHLDAIDQLGGMIARTALGAKRAVGEAALDRSVALGQRRAMFPALAAMMRIRLDPKDLRRVATLAEAATRAPAPTPLDRLLQRNAAAILVPVRAGDGEAASKLARQLLPFGRLTN
ncbi:hypothetical protein ABC347_14795 [Sphingomonas sp. 1P06PA]|uniref:hypothetical protein n=1 Tax=Sphingomonas sp. 1P06PA TaxID=554121 RepID=UPI0039A49A90